MLDAKKDLDKKIIRTVGDSDKKIEEDALRILRAVRFATTLNFKLDENLKSSIIKYKDNLKKLSYTRKKEELEKIFSSPNNNYGINLLKELKLEEPLDINLNIIVTQSSLGIWAQINNDKYPFTKQEKETIKKVNESLNENIVLATRNLPNVILLEASEINTYDVISADVMVVTSEAIKQIEEVLV